MTVPMTDAMQITVSSEMENRMDESNSTTPRPVPEPVSLSVSAAVALTIGEPFVQDEATNQFAVPKKNGPFTKKDPPCCDQYFQAKSQAETT